MNNFLDDLGGLIQSNPNSFISQKLLALFEGDDAPLNAESKAFQNFGTTLKTVYTKLEKTADKVEKLNTNITNVATSLSSWLKKIKSTQTLFDNLQTAVENATKKMNGVRTPKRGSSSSASTPGPLQITNMKTLLARLASIYHQLSPRNTVSDSFNVRLFEHMNRHLIVLQKMEAWLVAIHDKFANGKKESILSQRTTNIYNQPNKKGMTQSIMAYIDNSKKESKGSFLGSILGFILKAGLILTGLGLMKKWLDTSQTGIVIKSIVKNLFRSLANVVGTWVEKGNLKTLLNDGVSLITGTLSFLFNGVLNFYKKHQSKIDEAVSSSWDIVWNTVLVPLWNGFIDGIKESFSKNSEKQKSKTGNDSWLDKILDPIVAAFETAKPYLLTWFTLTLIPIIGAPFRLITKVLWMAGKGLASAAGWIGGKLWGATKSIFGALWNPAVAKKKMAKSVSNKKKWMRAALGRMGSVITKFGALLGRLLVIGGIIIALKSIYDSVTTMIGQYKELGEINKETVDIYTKQLANLEKRQTQTSKDRAEAVAKAKADPTEHNLLDEKRRIFQEKQQALDKTYAAQSKDIMTKWWLGPIGREIMMSNLTKQYDEQRSKLEKSDDYQGTIKRLLEIKEKEGKTSEKLIDTMKEQTKAMEKIHLGKTNSNNNEVKSVAALDAIIIQPHTKDQVVMAKKDGPIDLVMRDMVAKFDQMLLVMASGFGTMVNVTSEGSMTVAKAVASSGGGASGAQQSSGNDPVRELRDRAFRSMEGMMR